MTIGWVPCTVSELDVIKPFPSERGAGIWKAPVRARGERNKACALLQMACEVPLSFQSGALLPMIWIVAVCQALISWQLFSMLHRNWFSVSVTVDILLKPTVNEHKILLHHS